MSLAGNVSELTNLPTTGSTSVIEIPSSTPPETLGGPVFDSQLDSFLERFQKEIHNARALKDDLDRSNSDQPDFLAKKHHFKLRMQYIRALFSTEGEDFLASLEKHNPKLSMAVCGENTIELAQGIDRLETAVQEEESKRAAHVSHLPQPQSTRQGSAIPVSQFPLVRVPQNLDQNVSAPADRVVAPPLPVTALGQTLNNLTSDETLQLMQSDIQALKLELMRLQRSKVSNGTFAQPSPHSLPNRSVGPTSDSASGGSPFSLASLSPDKDGVPASILANHSVNVVRVKGRATGITPTYVSHLEQMKSRIEALEKKPLSRRAKSVARLGRTQTMGSMYESPVPLVGDENQHPNVSAMITPPRNIRRSKHRSISTSSPLAPHRITPPAESLRRLSPIRIQRTSIGGSPQPDVVRVGVSTGSPSSTPSPKRPSFAKGDGGESRYFSMTGKGAGGTNSTSPAKLYFDAPEELLNRPQSHAAAQDFRRYSLKVARRLIPFGAPDRVDGGNGNDELAVQQDQPSSSRVSESELFASRSEVEPKSTSTTTGATTGESPIRKVMVQSAVNNSSHARNDTSLVTPVGPGNAPSTIDTSGSGGRVVEEIEGDMWVRKGVVWKRWRRRYASIVSHQFFGKVMCLFSYDSNGGVSSTRSQIVVLHGSLCRSIKDYAEIGGASRFVFQLRTSSKEYYFAAESDETRRNWIKELRDAAQLDSVRAVHKNSSGRSMAFRRKP